MLDNLRLSEGAFDGITVEIRVVRRKDLRLQRLAKKREAVEAELASASVTLSSTEVLVQRPIRERRSAEPVA